MDYKRSDLGSMVRLFKGEEIVSALVEFAEREGVTAGGVLGIGAVGKAEIGFFDPERKEYLRRTFEGAFEVVNVTGNFTLVDGKPFLHAHITLADAEYRTIAGHLFSAVISVTGEFHVSPLPLVVPRVDDRETGLKLMDLTGDPESRIDVL